VECGLCPNGCVIGPGGIGSCRVRTNRGGVLYADSFGVVSSSQVDPIEKKPLYHFWPGTEIFSVGGWGCNLHCSFCQNWSISQEFNAEKQVFSPHEVVDAAILSGAPSIAYTYNEPLISLEFVRECAMIGREKGLNSVAVTNGYVSEESGRDAIEVIDAFNIDIKGMSEMFYSRNCSGRLAPVLDFCCMVKASGRHLELTNLVIPGENDRYSELEELVRWVVNNLGRDVPVHFSAYRPQYKMTNPATGTDVLNRAFDIARNHLDYVYLGNVLMERGQNSLCPQCQACLIKRHGYSIAVVGVNRGKCIKCGFLLEGFLWRVQSES